jgi:hypothetical protein
MPEIKIELLIAIPMLIGLVAIIATGQIRLYMGPPSWHNVNKQDDPGRFWLFVGAVFVVTVGLILQGLFG